MQYISVTIDRPYKGRVSPRSYFVDSAIHQNVGLRFVLLSACPDCGRSNEEMFIPAEEVGQYFQSLRDPQKFKLADSKVARDYVYKEICFDLNIIKGNYYILDYIWVCPKKKIEQPIIEQSEVREEKPIQTTLF